MFYLYRYKRRYKMQKLNKELLEFTKTLKVLYVEDNKEAQQAVGELLGLFFNDIVTAVDGVDGLEKFKVGNFDMVISDIKMPRMNGIDMAKSIRKTSPDTAIIIATAHQESEYLLECIRCSVDGYLLKPIDIEQLQESILKVANQIYCDRAAEIYEKQLKEEVEERTKELKLAHSKLTSMVNKDSMTGLYNRRYFNEISISMIAHQWRQPLTAISATSATINYKVKSDEMEKDFIIERTNRISEYSQHLSSTIDDFRDFFKPDKEQKDTTFEELLRSVFSIVEASLIQQNITLHQSLQYNDCFKSYPNELKQVILNLIKNSEDVLIEKNVNNPYIKLKTYKDKDSIVLEISDNGGGVNESIIDKIFDPYFSTKLKKDGTGLGLYMSKTIIEDHCNGNLYVNNSQDGAVFRIVLSLNT